MPWIYIFAFAIYFLNDAKDRYFLILISSIIEEIYTNANIEIQGIKPVSSRGWSPFCSLTTYSLNGESSEEPLGAQRHNVPASHWPSNPLDWRGCRVEGCPRPGLQEDPGSWVLETPVPKARGSVPHPLRALIIVIWVAMQVHGAV